jgi:CPA2 family monovalent cation:H+ antiporter-2
MEDTGLITDLVIALGATFLGGWVAHRLGQPVLIGYIIAGIVIGPNTPGLVADRHNVETLANLGVAFLMFTIGVELSFSELKLVRRLALVTGGIQIPATIVLGAIAGAAIGWSWQASILLGAAFALSSTIVVLKLAVQRGEAHSAHTHAALGIGIVQDLALVPIIAMLPVLAGSRDNLALSLLRSLGLAAVALAIVVLLGTRLVPRILFAVARTGSRELFIVTIVLIALGTALASERAGLSLALGAFLAGLVVSESEFDAQVLTEIIPLRDLFATLFFVSLGMLLEPGFLLDHLGLVAALAVVLVLGKLLIVGGAMLAAGVNYRIAARSAAFLSQMGEFSFVLAGVAMADGIIAHDEYETILAVALISILATPFLVQASPALVAMARHLPGLHRQEVLRAGEESPAARRGTQVVLCGYGRVGSVLGQVLARHDFRYSVIEINPATVRELRESGVPAFYGDAGSDALLTRAGIRHAEVLVVTVPELLAARATIRQARILNPSLTIITRAISRQELQVLRDAGADEVIQPEVEAGLECVRHLLQALGMPLGGVSSVVEASRTSQYWNEELPPSWDDLDPSLVEAYSHPERLPD